MNSGEYYEYDECGKVLDEYRERYGGNVEYRYAHSPLAIAGFGIVSGSAIPGAEWLIDWRCGEKTFQEDGLYYLLRI